MPVEAILAVVSFVALFAVWVILPSRLQKRHAREENDTLD